MFFKVGDTCWDSFLFPHCSVLITVNTRLVAGGCGASLESQGSNDGGQCPEAPGGKFVGGDSLLLMLRPQRSTSTTQAPSHTLVR